MSEIIPAILASSVADFRNKISELPKEIKYAHLDVLEEDIWTEIEIDFEAHLMVKEPTQIIPRWLERGAKRIIVHESSPEILIYRTQVEIGLEIEMQEFLVKELEQAPFVDFIHIMSIDEIGEQGHPFNPQVFDRIKEVREKFPNLAISVDGGINTSNYPSLELLGVDRLIVGSGFKDLWNSLMKK